MNAPRDGLAVAIALCCTLAACASSPKTSAPAERGFQASDPTTPEFLEYLVERGTDYRERRAGLLAALANAESTRDAPAKQGTAADPFAGGFSEINKSMGAIFVGKRTRELAELDSEWHVLLMDVLGKAPTVQDFDARAVALLLSPDQVQPYWALFQIYQTERKLS